LSKSFSKKEAIILAAMIPATRIMMAPIT
jgi:hypothetical protein